MQADLAERDSLIRVLQHHSSLSRASSISSLLASSHCASPRLSPQQQHRSPTSVVLQAGSKPSSGASSRQGSQLSAGSPSLNKNSKFGSYTDAGSFVYAVYTAFQIDLHIFLTSDETNLLKVCYLPYSSLG